MLLQSLLSVVMYDDTMDDGHKMMITWTKGKYEKICILLHTKGIKIINTIINPYQMTLNYFNVILMYYTPMF